MFSLVQFHKWDPHFIENMIPWEKMIYIDMLSKHIRTENEKQRDQDAINQRKMKQNVR